MRTALLELFQSKKFLAACTAVIVYIAGRFGFDVDTAALDHVYAALLIYVGAQGLCDVGKSAALARAKSASTADEEPEPSSSPPSDGSGSVAMLMLAILAMGAIGTLATACETVRVRGAAGAGAFIDCEADGIKQALPDLIPLARSAV